MEDKARTCGECGAANPVGAAWCWLCHAGFAPPPPPPPPPEVAGRGPTKPRRGRRIVTAGLALVVLLSMGRAWGLQHDAARFGATAEQGAIDSRGFRFSHIDPTSGEPVRFDPCTEVHYVVNRSDAPYNVLADVTSAFEATQQATGIHFVFDGYTDESFSEHRPYLQPGRYGRRWAPILITWVRGDAGLFTEEGIGLGGSGYAENADGRLVYVTGVIALNADEQLDTGFGVGETWGKAILHELGHVIGLGHVSSTAQVMNPNLVSTPAIWGPGDRAGLRELGVLAGCLADPKLPNR